MVTQKTPKGLQGVNENPCSNSLSRQASSLYNLTLDEVHTHLGNLGKPLGSMNLDELVKTIWTSESIDHPIPTNLPSGSWSPLNNNRHSSFSLSRDLSKKTVEEVWREIEQGKKDSQYDVEERQKNLGEMTLESFLNQAGVIVDSNAGSGSNPEWNQYQILPQHQSRREMPVFMPSLQLIPGNGDSAYLDMSMSPSNMMMGNLSDNQPLGRKRVAPGEIVEKTVERRQKRMIKNRESAARSRARKQAYTQELEIKISQLEEENERLKRTKGTQTVAIWPVRIGKWKKCCQVHLLPSPSTNSDEQAHLHCSFTMTCSYYQKTSKLQWCWLGANSCGLSAWTPPLSPIPVSYVYFCPTSFLEEG
ncbi:hypothetical protein V2J09_013840 [Rumex salicifolius]